MKSRHHIALTVAIATAFAASFGCSDDDCPYGSANDLKIQFLSLADTTSFTVDTLTVTAEGTDSVLLNKQTNMYYITLPMNGTSETTTYTFEFTILGTDTIETSHTLDDGTVETYDSVVTVVSRYYDIVEVNYNAEKLFTSMDCGLVYSFELESGSHSTNYIKSMTIVNTEISEDNEENIYMFF